MDYEDYEQFGRRRRCRPQREGETSQAHVRACAFLVMKRAYIRRGGGTRPPRDREALVAWLRGFDNWAWTLAAAQVPRKSSGLINTANALAYTMNLRRELRNR